jgi:acetyl-CoA carboxylase biotin carboxyl carrier protein
VAAVEAPKADNYITVKSPMIGTFYRQSGPGKPIFINVGDEIAPGKVVCIIEAMKLFNEIESEVTGKIVKVLVEDASPVEYDQPLFLVDPS